MKAKSSRSQANSSLDSHFQCSWNQEGSEPSRQVGVDSHFPGQTSGWGPAHLCRLTGEGSTRKLGGSHSHPGHPDSYRPEALWLKLPSCHSWA